MNIPDLWIAVLNIISWPCIMFSVSFLILKVHLRRFSPDRYMFRTRRWESDGTVFTRFFYVKRWKGLLPDGAAWFSGGFAKKTVQCRSRDYLEQFVFETCRGETAHWISLAFVPVFFIYNPPWAAVVMVVAGLFLNVPCIVVQRFNRIQLMRLVHLSSKGRR